MPYFVLGCRALVVLISLSGKMRSRDSYRDFESATRRLAPFLPASVLAPLVVLAETATVVLLVVPMTSVAGLASAFLIFTAFTVGLVMALGCEPSIDINALRYAISRSDMRFVRQWRIGTGALHAAQ
ncbi:MauE/DoxX family redox-associated membrane protein [Herbidospora cretacea]|uniref:MauE/DoxX family redox-associated membrane protein n=1 Tax=Herbidospora cretacea TaxID=28444 RepID=UPI0004C33BD5|nr:MauE/DoxX family redox-associated membrane protein [Herbidospora cretacea]